MKRTLKIIVGMAAVLAAVAGVLSYIAKSVIPSYDLLEAQSIGIIGGADGPTAIFLSSKLFLPVFGWLAVTGVKLLAGIGVIVCSRLPRRTR